MGVTAPRPVVVRRLHGMASIVDANCTGSSRPRLPPSTQHRSREVAHAGDGLVAVASRWRYHTGPRTPARSQPTWRLPHESLPTRRDVLSNRRAIGPLHAGQAHSAATRLVRGLNSSRDEF